LKNLKIAPVKFKLKKVNDNEYVVVFNFPFIFKFTYDAKDGFCKIFKFQKLIQSGAMLAPNIDYTSENIKEMMKPFSVIEWHCNITEHSYTNHDDYSHLHQHIELLHFSFVENNFYDNLCIRKFLKKK